MNAIIEAIKSRRSVRAYEDRPVPREMIEQIIDAGNWAPTGNNQQHWRFVVVRDPAFRRKLYEAAQLAAKAPLAAMARSTDEAHRAYAVDMFERTAGWPHLAYEEAFERGKSEDWIYWDAPAVIFVIGPPLPECSLVCENMMLAAYALGLGSCMVGLGSLVMDDPEIVAALEIRGAEKIHGPIVLGYPRFVPAAPPKKDPVVKWI